jgi:hypothetical protein
MRYGEREERDREREKEIERYCYGGDEAPAEEVGQGP